MDRIIRSCLRMSLKLVNSSIGMVGIAMIMYGVWMIRVWERTSSSSVDDDDFFANFPWFIHAFLGAGVALCGITCLGHIAAHSANSCCLSFYMVIILILVLWETTFTADVFLNPDWEKDLPDDPSGRLDDFKDFVKSNIETCQWVALFVILAQGISIMLAAMLRSIRTEMGVIWESDDDDDDDDEYAHQPSRYSLLNCPTETYPSYVVDQPNVFDYQKPVNLRFCEQVYSRAAASDTGGGYDHKS